MKSLSCFYFFCIFFISLSGNCFAQEDGLGKEPSKKGSFDVDEVVEVEEDDIIAADVPFAVIEEVPVYPGCEDLEGNQNRKKCMSDKLSELVNSNFVVPEKERLSEEVEKRRIYTSFKINAKGEVVDVRFRAANGANPELEKEVQRVMGLIPKMKPGMQRGRNVGVLYFLPIIYKTGNVVKR